MKNIEELILDRLDKLSDDIQEIKINTAKHTILIEQNTKDLTEHIRRTNLLEQTIDNQKIECCIKHAPLSFYLVCKRIVLISAVTSAIYGIIHIIGIL